MSYGEGTAVDVICTVPKSTEGLGVWNIEARLDRDTAEKIGAVGTFQVIGLTDAEGKDLTDLVDQGRHFSDLEELKSAILTAIATRLTIEEVT